MKAEGIPELLTQFKWTCNTATVFSFCSTFNFNWQPLRQAIPMALLCKAGFGVQTTTVINLAGNCTNATRSLGYITNTAAWHNSRECFENFRAWLKLQIALNDFRRLPHCRDLLKNSTKTSFSRLVKSSHCQWVMNFAQTSCIQVRWTWWSAVSTWVIRSCTILSGLVFQNLIMVEADMSGFYQPAWKLASFSCWASIQGKLSLHQNIGQDHLVSGENVREFWCPQFSSCSHDWFLLLHWVGRCISRLWLENYACNLLVLWYLSAHHIFQSSDKLLHLPIN